MARKKKEPVLSSTPAPPELESLDILVGDLHVFLLDRLGGTLDMSLGVAVPTPSKVPADSGFLLAWLIARPPGFIAGAWDYVRVWTSVQGETGFPALLRRRL